MFSDPQISLSVLESINYSQIKGNDDRALYALLLTQARDKCYRFETDDSLISTAVDYYENKILKNNDNLMLSHMYKGIINLYSKNYSEALFESAVALSLTSDDDYFYRGKIHELMADLYSRSYNMTTAVYHRSLAQYFYNKTDKKLFSFYAANDLARNIMDIDSIDRAMNIVDSLDNIPDDEFTGHKPILNMTRIYAYLAMENDKAALQEYLSSKFYNQYFGYF